MTKGASQVNTNAHPQNCHHIARIISGKSTKNVNLPVMLRQENAKIRNARQVNTFVEIQKMRDFPMRHIVVAAVLGSITTLALEIATNQLENAIALQ